MYEDIKSIVATLIWSGQDGDPGQEPTGNRPLDKGSGIPVRMEVEV